MNKNKHSISIIIIGYNTKGSLENLLLSLNNQKVPLNTLIEIVYVDDASTDGSFNFFNDFPLQFKKNSYKFLKNAGRSVATNMGIKLSQYDWCFFVRSNEVVFENTLNIYIQYINKYTHIDAFVGDIYYSCKDKIFEKYLNNLKRGIKKYISGEVVHYKFLLLGNCLIHKKIFSNNKFNEGFKRYGGEELDFAYYAFYKNKKDILASPDAIVRRENHPSFSNHLIRMQTFGEYNFKYLCSNNQKNVIGIFYYLQTYSFLVNFWKLCLFISQSLYKYDLNRCSFYIIRLGFLSAIMIGRLKSK